MTNEQKVLNKIADMLCTQDVGEVIATLRTIAKALNAVSYSRMDVVMAALEVEEDAE